MCGSGCMPIYANAVLMPSAVIVGRRFSVDEGGDSSDMIF